MRIFPLFLALSLLPLTAPAKTELVREGGGWKLLRDGKPYFIKGGDGDTKLEVLAAAGGGIRSGFRARDAGMPWTGVLRGVPTTRSFPASGRAEITR